MRRQVSYANNTSSSLQQLNPCVYFSSLTPSGQVYQGTGTVDFRQPLSTINPSLQIARPTHHHLKRPSRDRPTGHPSGLKQQQQDIDSLMIRLGRNDTIRVINVGAILHNMTAGDWRAERDWLRRQTVVAHHPPHIDWLDAKSIICTRKCKAHGSALKLSQTRHSTESPRPTKLIIILSDPAATLSHYRIQSTRHCQITDPQTPPASPYHHTTTRVVIHYDSNYLLTMHMQLFPTTRSAHPSLVEKRIL